MIELAGGPNGAWNLFGSHYLCAHKACKVPLEPPLVGFRVKLKSGIVMDLPLCQACLEKCSQHGVTVDYHEDYRSLSIRPL